MSASLAIMAFGCASKREPMREWPDRPFAMKSTKAAFAAASITNADPMRTGFSAVKSGIVMFTIPFVFAIYPELLLIDQAIIDPNSGAFLNGHDGNINILGLMFLLARVVLALYLVSSALAGFDRFSLSILQITIRVALAVLILATPIEIYGLAVAAGIGLIMFHYLSSKQGGPPWRDPGVA